MNKPVLLLGAGGHARVLVDILLQQQVNIAGIVAPLIGDIPEFQNIDHFLSDDDVFQFDASEVELVNAIGSIPNDNNLRRRLYEHFKQAGYSFRQMTAPSAIVSKFAIVHQGVQLLPGSLVNASEIKENSIVNTGAIIEHDVKIGRHCHIAPGAVICGGVVLSDNVHVGAGATIIQGIEVGEGAIIGAGSVVTKDIPAKATHFPAKPFVKKEY
ncbi:MAG: acetyltransferase [Alcanivorax sp.]|nr:MAG: acetyltransferase [Alcanivorax sp.]